MRQLLLATIAAATALVPLPAFAEPPPWAPAHGWRKKHDPYYVGYTGKKWSQDYGIVSGRCNTDAIGAVLGGVVGGAVGSQVGSGENRPVAVIVGGVLGAIVGAKIGRDMDERDRACMGHALELGADGRPVAWTNPATGVAYQLVPGRSQAAGKNCRSFTTALSLGSASDSVGGLACRRARGEWEIRS